MRRPATFGDFVTAAVYAVGVVQLAVAGFVALWTLGGTLATAGRRGFGLPEWLFPTDVVLSTLAVAAMAVAYRRGALDSYDVRRGRQR